MTTGIQGSLFADATTRDGERGLRSLATGLTRRELSGGEYEVSGPSGRGVRRYRRHQLRHLDTELDEFGLGAHLKQPSGA